MLWNSLNISSNSTNAVLFVRSISLSWLLDAESEVIFSFLLISSVCSLLLPKFKNVKLTFD